MIGDKKSSSNRTISKFGYVQVKVVEEYCSATGFIIGYLVEVGTSKTRVIISSIDFIERDSI
jgi:hypothetical protein